MTNCNDTETTLYNQLRSVQKCIDALKDVYENIPDEDRYSCVLAIVGERLEVEFNTLFPMAMGASNE
jgi:hypothetical protein